MAIFDELPPPNLDLATRSQSLKSKLQFAQILNGFALVYLFLHKFLMPLFVIYTSSLPTPSIEKLDWWWLYHVVIAILFSKKQAQKHFFRGVLAFGLAGLVVQVLESFSGKSWHSLSLWLTATTTLVVLGYVYHILPKLKWREQSRVIGLGLCLGFLTEGSLYYFYGRIPYVLDLRTETSTGMAPKILGLDQTLCGVNGFSLSVIDGQIQWPNLKPLDELEIRDCGLPYPLAYVPVQDLKVYNPTQNYLNLKLSLWNGQAWQGYKNIPLPKGMHEQISQTDLQHDVILLTSDARPQVGLMLLIKNQNALIRLFQLQGKEKPLLYAVTRQSLQVY